MRFQTEMQHIIPDLRSAPIHEHSTPYMPVSLQDRTASLEPQQEIIIPIQRPGFVSKQSSGHTFRYYNGSHLINNLIEKRFSPDFRYQQIRFVITSIDKRFGH